MCMEWNESWRISPSNLHKASQTDQCQSQGMSNHKKVSIMMLLPVDMCT